MRTPTRIVLVALCLTFASVSAFSEPAPHPQIISGRVIAYSSAFPACLNGNGYWSVLIRVEKPKSLSPQFIRLDFSLPCDKSPDWISADPLVKSFRLVRDKSADAVLSGCLQEECGQNQSLPIWIRPAAGKPDALPFGQTLPSYRSVDLPMIPVV